MNIGDYVRTINGKLWIIKSQKAISGHKKDIINYSPNIIDLIEYGDIVKYKIDNEEFISEVWGEKNNYFVQNFDVPIDLIDLNIVSVITHEQFSQMEYKVGD